jgi:type II secretory pathway predicted ATPase ExeA
MLLKNFGFNEDPFSIDPNVRFFYYDAARQHINAHLTSNIRKGKGFVLLSGEHGIGKTILLRHLAHKLEAVHGITLLPPSGVLSCETSPSFGKIVRACFLPPDNAHDAAVDYNDEANLEQFLECHNKAGSPAALILDGADHLSLEVLERLKALSAQIADDRVALSIVLAGCLEPPKGQTASAIEATQKNADVNLRLQRFQARDVEPYVRHRIQLAGRKGPALFAPSAIDRIIHYSGGNPLSINRICRSALVIADRQTIKTVSAEIIDSVAAGSLREPIVDHSWSSGKGPVNTSDPELPHVTRLDSTDTSNDQPRSPAAVSDKTTPATEDVEEKFLFRAESNLGAERTAKGAALVRIPSPIPLEEFALGDHAGVWSQDRVGAAVRFVWIFLATTLLLGVTGVYLAQTGRFDAIEFSKNWLALTGRESTPPQSDPRELGYVVGQPTFWVEPSSKLDQDYPLETASNAFAVAPHHPREQKQQSSGSVHSEDGSPANLGSGPKSDQAFSQSHLPTSPKSIPALDATTKRDGQNTEPKSDTDADVFIDLPQLAVSKDSELEIAEAIKISESLNGVESSRRFDEAGTGREQAEDSRSMTEPIEGAERFELAADGVAVRKADESMASKLAAVEMETAAGSGDDVESPEVAVDEDPAARSNVSVPSQAISVKMGTATGAADARMDGPVVAEELGTTTKSDELVVGQNAAVEMETAAGSGDDVESPEVAVDEDPAARSNVSVPSQAVPVKMEPVVGTEETVERHEASDATGSVVQADEPAAWPVRSSTETPDSLVNDDHAENLRSASMANSAQEVTVTIPVPAGVDLSGARDESQSQPESRPQRSESEVVASEEPPSPIQVAESTQSQLDLDRLVARGDQLLALGDVASARLFYRLAATKGSATGATDMASTYDPIYLERIGIVGVRPSPVEAIKWYRQAIDMGHRGAVIQLRELTDRLEREAALGDGEAQRILNDVRN